jgi:adenylylsulfate reductase subunit A
MPTLHPATLQQCQTTIGAPLETFDTFKGASTADEITPHYLTPEPGLVRLQKIMDEYAARMSAWYTTNGCAAGSSAPHLGG